MEEASHWSRARCHQDKDSWASIMGQSSQLHHRQHDVMSVLCSVPKLECDGLPPHGGSSAGCRWRTKLASRPVSASAEAGTADDWQYSCQASLSSKSLPQVAQLCAALQPNTLCTALRQAASSCRRSSRKVTMSDAEQGQPAPAHLAQGRTTITAHCKLQEMSCPLLQCIFGTLSLAVKGMAAEETHRARTYRHLRHGGLAEPPGVCAGAAAVSHHHEELLQLAHDGILQQI